MAAQCQPCGAATPDGLLMCTRCYKGLRDTVGSVSWLVGELETAYLRQDRFGAQVSMARSAERPLPWNDRAARVADSLGWVVRMWAETLAEHDPNPRDLIPLTGLVDTARWLTRNLVAVRTHPAAGTAHRELTNAVERAVVTVDRPPELLAYGVCDAELPEGNCVAFLYAAPGRELIRCRKCGAEHRKADRREWMMSYLRDREGTATEVSRMLAVAGVRVTPNAIAKMGEANRVRVTSVEQAGRRVRLYRVAEVIDATSNRYQRRVKALVASDTRAEIV